MHVDDSAHHDDVELRLVDPAKNRFRLYGLTECRNLFGELCLRIVWGRIGNRRLRERTEVFEDHASLLRRRAELLRLRRRHGYVSTSTPRAAARAHVAKLDAQDSPVTVSPESKGELAIARAVLEDHWLPVEDAVARRLVAHWHEAITALVRYLDAKGAGLLDLVDASTLAAMFVQAGGVAS